MTEFVVYDIFGADGIKKPADKSGERFPFFSMAVGDFFDAQLHMRRISIRRLTTTGIATE